MGNHNFHHFYSPLFSVAAPSQSTAIAQEVRFIAKFYPQIRITCSSIGGSISSVSSSSSISSGRLGCRRAACGPARRP
jgi:hypothetical protein